MTAPLRKLEVRLEGAREDSELVGQLVEHRGRFGFEPTPPGGSRLPLRGESDRRWHI